MKKTWNTPKLVKLEVSKTAAGNHNTNENGNSMNSGRVS